MNASNDVPFAWARVDLSSEHGSYVAAMVHEHVAQDRFRFSAEAGHRRRQAETATPADMPGGKGDE